LRTFHVPVRLTTALAAVSLTLAIIIASQAIGGASPAPLAKQPPPAEMVLTVAGTSQPDRLIDTLPFDVQSVSAFLLDDQQFVTYIPGAPAHVNKVFRSRIRPDDIVWLRVPAGSSGLASQWTRQSLAQTISTNGPRALDAPRPGGLTVGLAGSTTVEGLIQAQPFTVAGVLIFDTALQHFKSYMVGAPDFANTLSPAVSLEADSIVWLRRSYAEEANTAPRTPQDTPAPQAPSGSNLAAVPSAPAPTGSQDASSPSRPRADAPQAPTPAPQARAAAPQPTSAPASTLAAAAPPVRSTSGLLRHTTYEPGSPTREEAHTATSHALSTTSIARTGERAGVALLKPGDPTWHAGGYRAEWHAQDHVGAGKERWQGISYYFPRDYNQGKNSTWNDRIIFQYTDEGSPMFSLHLDAERQQLFLRRKTSTGGTQTFQELGRWSFQTDRWYDIAFHAVWSKGGDGVFEVYVDGEREVSYRGRTLAVRDTTYSKWGVYGQPTKLYFDEIRIAEGPNRLADVTP